MPSITTVHESLPYIDPEPTPSERTAAESLIATERSAVPDDPYHALLPPKVQPNFSPLVQAELDRIANSADPNKPAPLDAIDLSRYELPDLDAAAAGDREGGRGGLTAALAQAYAAATYLSSRRQHLALLASHGRNAWLVGNWQLEAELASLERELAAARRAVDLVALRRQRLQDASAAEIRGLDDAWRRGVGRVLEAELAAEALRREVDAAMRQGAAEDAAARVQGEA